MSELIDSIFDVAKISKEVANITADLDGLKQTIVNYSDDVKKAMDATRASKSQDDLLKNTKSINDAMSGAQKVTKEYQTELEKLKAKTDQLTGAEKAANIEIAKARLELAAAQKEVKAAAIAEIEAAAATGKLNDSYNALDKELKKAKAAYREMTSEEKKASGDELLKKIQQLDKDLKKADASMGVFNRNVGNYAGAIESMLPKIGGLAGVILNTGQAASSGEGGFKALGKTIVETGKAMLKNPFVLIGAAIIGLIKGIKNAIGESEERTNAISTAFAQFKPILRTIGDGFEFLADAVIKTVGFLGKAFSAVTEFLGINPKGSADQFVQAEKSKQKAILETRKLNEDASNQEAIIAEQREIIANKEDYSYKQRVEALKKAGEAEKQLSLDRQRIAELNLKALEEEAALDDNDAAMNDKLSAAIVSVNNARRESASVQRTLAKEEQRLIKENEADLKAQADAARAAAKERAAAAKEAARNILEAQRRLTDSQLALMSEGEEKQIAINAENFKRKLEDLKANGQLTAELQKNLEEVNAKEVQKIRDEAAKTKADKDAKEFDKQLAAFEKNLQREVAILEAAYNDQAVVLKKQFAAGKLSRKEYDEALVKLQSDAAKEANDKTIELLKSELEMYGISADKKAELSAKIRDLQIANENAVLDATIEANQKKIDSDRAALEKRLHVAEELAGVGLELYAAVGEFQTQQSEQHIEELEAQQAKSDELFEKQQANLDRAAMSEENRALAQQKLNEDKEKRDKAIADKVKAEKIRAAKWEKAQAIISAGINTALAGIKALVDPGGILGAVYAVAAGITGAASIATIASKSIPAYAKGGVTGEGLALWGEERTEVAVTPTGHVMFAESPTVTNFDAGTRIFKSVEDYERNISATNVGKNFEFDYDKFAEAMPKTTVNLDSNGLWSVMKGQQSRVIMVNRKYKLN